MSSTKCGTASTQAKQLVEALEIYHLQQGRYPAELVELTHGTRPWLRALPLDSWDQPFTFQIVDGIPLVTSSGADGVLGTQDDVSNAHRPRFCMNGPPSWELYIAGSLTLALACLSAFFLGRFVKRRVWR